MNLQQIPTIGVLGSGKLNKALLRGFTKIDPSNELNIIASVRTEQSLKLLQNEFPYIHGTLDNHHLIKNSKWIFLGIKPYDVHQTLTELSPLFNPTQHLLSLCAGVSLIELLSIWDKSAATQPKIHRLMANTAMQTCNGIFGHQSEEALPEDLAALLSEIGKIFKISEDQFDSFTTLSASSAAFILETLKGLEKYAQKNSFDSEMSLKIIKQLLLGTAELIRPTDKNSLSQSIEQIATPGGMTEAGLLHLRKHKTNETVESACDETQNKCSALMGNKNDK